MQQESLSKKFGGYALKAAILVTMASFLFRYLPTSDSSSTVVLDYKNYRDLLSQARALELQNDKCYEANKRLAQQANDAYEKGVRDALANVNMQLKNVGDDNAFDARITMQTNSSDPSTVTQSIVIAPSPVPSQSSQINSGSQDNLQTAQTKQNNQPSQIIGHTFLYVTGSTNVGLGISVIDNDNQSVSVYVVPNYNLLPVDQQIQLAQGGLPPFGQDKVYTSPSDYSYFQSLNSLEQLQITSGSKNLPIADRIYNEFQRLSAQKQPVVAPVR